MTRKAPNSGGRSGAATAPLVATEAQDAAKREKFRSALRRARFNKSIGKLADKEFATKDRLVKAAYGEAKGRATHAWRKSSEFQIAMYYAVALKTMEPLAKFLESKTLLTRSNRLALARFVRSFEAPQRGRPSGRLKSDFYEAQRNVVYRVWLGQQVWRKKYKRQRVPKSVTNELIAENIYEASKAFPKAKLSSDDIRALVNKASRKIID